MGHLFPSIYRRLNQNSTSICHYMHKTRNFDTLLKKKTGNLFVVSLIVYNFAEQIGKDYLFIENYFFKNAQKA